MTRLKTTAKLLFLFGVGGVTYYAIELLWRGYSHISMLILGGICFVLLGLINELLPWNMGLLWQSLIGSGVVTILELITGSIVNVHLGLGVWNYSNLPLNFMGQISVVYTLLWVPLSCVAIVLDDYIRYRFFNEEKPHYKIV